VVQKRIVVRVDAYRWGNLRALGKIECIMDPRDYPKARIFPAERRIPQRRERGIHAARGAP
jgi:hypothetical protein